LEHGVLTITNILKKFNPEIKGYSSCPSTRDNVRRSGLNVAEPGGDNADMPGQARFLINRIKNDTHIDFWADWKMLTMFVGGNDLCASCDDWDKYSPEAYGAKVREAVDILFNELPRVFLNIVPIFDVTPLSELSQNVLCDSLQTRFCDCAVNEITRAELRNTQLGYFAALKSLTDDPKYTYREDFAVVLQPHLRDFDLPRDPETGDYMDGFLSPDCFHPSRLGHQSFAFSLWNTMLTPVSQKPVSSTVNMGPEPNILRCPTTIAPYLFTNMN
jgi:phospholipase B1